MPSKSYDRYVNGVPSVRTVSTVYSDGGSENDTFITSPGHRTRDARSWSWANTPSFAVKRKAGLLPTNAMTLTESRNYFGDAEAVYTYWTTLLRSTTTWKESSSIGWSNTIPGDFVYGRESAYASAVSSLRSKIRDSEFSLPILLGEAGKTATLVTHTATRLYNSWRALRRGDLSHFLSGLGLTTSRGRVKKFNARYGRGPLEAASSAWLEYSYGWRPLLNDIHHAAESLAKFNNTDYAREFLAMGRGRETGLTVSPPSLWSFSGKAVSECWIGARYRYSGGQASVGTALGLNNPLEVAWELLPYSFVVDWFVPIGNYLSQLGSISDSHVFVKGYVCRLDWLEGSYALDYKSSTSSSSYASKRVVGWKYRKFDRAPLSGFPAAVMKPVRLPKSIGQALSAIALLTNAFKR